MSGTRSRWLLIAAVLGTGCGQPKLTGDIVASGRVTLDGKDVPRAIIEFQPFDGIGIRCRGEVIEGRYRVEGLMPGMKRVFIGSLEDPSLWRANGNGKFVFIDPAKPLPDIELFRATHPSQPGELNPVDP